MTGYQPARIVIALKRDGQTDRQTRSENWTAMLWTRWSLSPLVVTRDTTTFCLALDRSILQLQAFIRHRCNSHQFIIYVKLHRKRTNVFLNY